MPDQPLFPRSSDAHEHPSDDALEMYSLSRLSGAELDAVEDHLFRCAHCQERVSLEEEYLQAVKLGLQAMKEVEKPASRPWLARALSIAASVIIGTFGLTWWTLHPTAAVSPAVLTLSPLRAASANITVKPHQPLAIRIPREGLTTDGPFRVDIVRADNQPAWSGPTTASTNHLEIRLTRGLAPGHYWVRVHDSATQVAEMSLAVE